MGCQLFRGMVRWWAYPAEDLGFYCMSPCLRANLLKKFKYSYPLVMNCSCHIISIPAPTLWNGFQTTWRLLHATYLLAGLKCQRPSLVTAQAFKNCSKESASSLPPCSDAKHFYTGIPGREWMRWNLLRWEKEINSVLSGLCLTANLWTQDSYREIVDEGETRIK